MVVLVVVGERKTLDSSYVNVVVVFVEIVVVIVI